MKGVAAARCQSCDPQTAARPGPIPDDRYGTLVAPQIVAYRRLGGPRSGDLSADREPSVAPSAPLITIGMWIVLAILALVTAAAIVEFT